MDAPVTLAMHWPIYHAVVTNGFIPYLNNETDLDSYILKAQQEVDLIVGE